MGSHSNDDILIKIIKGEVAAPEALNSAELFARDIGLEPGEDLVPITYVYYQYCLWCKAVNRKPKYFIIFVKELKYPSIIYKRRKHYKIKDIFDYVGNEKKKKDDVLKWQANQERKEKAQKKRSAKRKKTIAANVREIKKIARNRRKNEYRRERRRLLKEKEVQRKSEALPDESLISLLDLKNGTSQE